MLQLQDGSSELAVMELFTSKNLANAANYIPFSYSWWLNIYQPTISCHLNFEAPLKHNMYKIKLIYGTIHLSPHSDFLYALRDGTIILLNLLGSSA